MLELRQLGGALDPARVACSARWPTAAAPFSMNAIGDDPDPGVGAARSAATSPTSRRPMRPHTTGATYLNFLDLDGATPQRVRARLLGAGLGPPRRTSRARRDPDNVFRFNRNIPPSP